MRYLAAFAVAGVVTFGLFWVMQALIGVEGTLDERVRGAMVDFVRLQRESEVEAKKRKLPEKQKPDEQPPPPELRLSRNQRPDQDVGTVIPLLDTSLGLIGGPNVGAIASDTDIVPLVRVNPQYPERAAMRGVEGWVEVEFTISPAGGVQDAKVLRSEPSSIFNRSALRAIRKWKYNPKIENGAAISRPGVVVRLTFELED